jgi:hypothetical protein
LCGLFVAFVCVPVPAVVPVCAPVILSTNAVAWLLLLSCFISQDVVCSPAVTLYGEAWENPFFDNVQQIATWCFVNCDWERFTCPSV